MFLYLFLLTILISDKSLAFTTIKSKVSNIKLNMLPKASPPITDDDDHEKRLQFKAFADLHMAIEERMNERVAPPQVTHSVSKAGSKKIPVSITVSRAASVVVIATDKPLDGSENFALIKGKNATIFY